MIKLKREQAKKKKNFKIRTHSCVIIFTLFVVLLLYLRYITLQIL